MKKSALPAVAALLVLLARTQLLAHCEVPCGIYDDHMRIHMIEENCTTIEKAMTEITELSKHAKADSEVSLTGNQLVRWIVTKEEHADQIQHTVAQYFLTQRVKAPAEAADMAAQKEYQRQLELLHGILVAALKCKQTVDAANAAKVRSLLAEFEKAYFKQ